ncbi:MAG TPA: hypothetical protein VG826_13640 [Pirellulales bacterium]|nr:hypothetical protein [Pirellulales bacterium]
MRNKMQAEFRCQRNGDGTCGAQIVIDGEDVPSWRVASGAPAELQRLYLDFVIAHLVCPVVQGPCDGCLPPEFMERLSRIIQGENA